MTNKIFNLVVLSMLSVVAVLGIVSAVSLDSITQYTIPSIVNQSAGTFNIIFNLENNGEAGNLTWTPTITSGASIAFNDSNIANGSITPVIETIRATVTFPTTMTGTISGVINVTGTGMSTYKTLAFSVPITLPSTNPVTCAYGNTHNNLRIKKIEFTNNGFSETDFGKDDEWFPIDSITAEMTIENKGNEKIEDIEIEWGLYDTSSHQWVIELDNEKSFSLSHDKNKVVTVDFSLDNVDVDLEDLTDGTHTFYVRATGYDNEYSEDVCTIDTADAEVIIETDFVVLDKINVPETTSCGTDLLVLADVWNIGEDDQEGVYVKIYNKELKIDQNIQIGDVDAFSLEKLNAAIAIPTGVADKNYNIVFSVYNEDDDVYVNDYNDDESAFIVPAKITCTGGESSGAGEGTKAVVSASLESGGKAGQDLVVKATITNLDSKSATFALSATGYSDWASSAKADKSTFTLAAGESASALFTFAVSKDAQGEQNFYLEVISGGKVVTRQPVSVTVEKSGFSLLQLGGSNYLWAIAIINVILVIAIIIIAVRIMRK